MHAATKTQPKSQQRFFICGGGTGGHFFSGVALAEIFLKKYPESVAYFLGTRQGIEARYPLIDSRMKKIFILSKGVKGKSIFQKVVALLLMGGGVLQSLLLLARYRPHIVAGVGGYASAPTLLAAVLMRWLFRWRVFVLDQNSTPGMVNRLFSRFPLRAYCAFPARGFQLVDLPLRSSYLDAAQKRREIHWPPQKVLIVGGSQGARGLNEAWMNAIPVLLKEFPTLTIMHQTGTADELRVLNFYEQQGIRAEVFAFSDQMPRFLDAADLVICRSGAMTVFEVMAFQRPAIFVPFPRATDDHQTKNALSVQSAEWVIPESQVTGERLLKLFCASEPALPHRHLEDVESWDRIL